ncbi:SDR family NAD(P)-dependent oxidoreductase [Pseudarthrobacter sp. NamE5]|uniref:SDR family NAD(P)-dependent oxidoreductase n=1 Tax=Pseudarthrobacter sp. NamE5 TaxID=2576839 RepID=UPI00110BD046|nr:SDR family oxidoreductase [Pseudarthrobacter sp. NamE5]TLM80761.1 SDR family oxidoreductase [Pseudarthrobacter sp. NamE5]
MRLAGRTAIVTGGSSGIGRAIALRFAREEANVVVSDIREEPIWNGEEEAPTADLITAEKGAAVFHQTDVSDAAAIDGLVERAVSQYGRLDILVNNAGLVFSSSVLDTSEDDWDRLMDVNLRGQFLSCKRGIRQMIDQDPIGEVRGRVINVASQHGLVGPPDFFAYAVSKGGMIQMTRQLAVDYAKHGIIVNGIAPGRIITGTHPGEVDMTDPVLEYSRSRTPFPRLGRAEDVAGAALFLASDDCSYISGHNLLVDGGWMAY